ncbi:DUF814 family protein, partial [Reticulomyxa filosa]
MTAYFSQSSFLFTRPKTRPSKKYQKKKINLDFGIDEDDEDEEDEDEDDDMENGDKVLSAFASQLKRLPQGLANPFEESLLEDDNESTGDQESSIFGKKGRDQNLESIFSTTRNAPGGTLPAADSDLPKGLFDFDVARFAPPSFSAKPLGGFGSRRNSEGTIGLGGARAVKNNRTEVPPKRDAKQLVSFDTMLGRKLFEQEKKEPERQVPTATMATTMTTTAMASTTTTSATATAHTIPTAASTTESLTVPPKRPVANATAAAAAKSQFLKD